MWFEITPEDSDTALQFALETVHRTYNRMGYGNTPGSLDKRQFHIYVGKVADRVVFRYLHEVLGLSVSLVIDTVGPAKFDFSL